MLPVLRILWLPKLTSFYGTVNKLMEQTLITDRQIQRAHIQPKNSLELNAGRIVEFVHLFYCFLEKLPTDLLEKGYWTSQSFRLHYHGWF